MFYDLLYLAFIIICLPVYLLKGKFHQGFSRRLGILPRNLQLDRPIWIHAVSVGEVMAVRVLVDGLRRIYPEKKFVISTVTPTGNKIAQGIAKAGDLITYLPLDFSFTVRKVLGRINPALFIIVETEIWPNLIFWLYRKNTPIVTVNGRISDVSFRGYLMAKFLVRSILNKISLFCVQTDRDAQRLIQLGVANDNIKITGNMKFDFHDYRDFKEDYRDYRFKLGLASCDKLLVAGSTHRGEERIILGVYKKILSEFSHLRLLIAPRHPERAQELVGLTKDFGFAPERISLLSENSPRSKDRETVFILDTVGELMHFYALADIVFVGGSLVKKGGHNILEPASIGKPVIFGPYMFNFRDIAQLFLKHKAAIIVYNYQDLKINIANILSSPQQGIELGERARCLIQENQGATQRNVQYIYSLLR